MPAKVIHRQRSHCQQPHKCYVSIFLSGVWKFNKTVIVMDDAMKVKPQREFMAQKEHIKRLGWKFILSFWKVLLLHEERKTFWQDNNEPWAVSEWKENRWLGMSSSYAEQIAKQSRVQWRFVFSHVGSVEIV